MRKRVPNEYYENIKYTLFVLRLTSVFPFGFQKNGIGGKWSQISSAILSLVAVAIYYLVIHNSFQVFREFFTMLVNNPDFNEIIDFLLNVYVRLFFLLMPILTWQKGPRLRNHIDHWRQFQIDFQIVSAQFLVNKSARRQMRYAFLICFTTSTVIYISLTQSSSIYNEFILATVALVVVYTHYFLVLYWYINGVIIVSTVETFLTELEHSLKIGDHRKLKKFMQVWLKLRDLSEEFQESNSSLFLGHLGLIIINGVTQIYFIMNILSGKMEGAGGPVVAALIITAVVFIHLYMDVAEQTLFKMTSATQNTLINRNIMYVDPQLIKEIWHFLDIISTNPPTIDLNGYISMARSVFLSIIAAALNFVIIIRQFGMHHDAS